MTHEQIQERLNEWLDGELDPAVSADASRHIDSCPECKEEVSRLRRLGGALFKTTPPADPRSTEAFVARVMARVEADAVSSWERLVARFLTPALGLALAGLLFTIIAHHSDEDASLGVAAAIDDAAGYEVAP